MEITLGDMTTQCEKEKNKQRHKYPACSSMLEKKTELLVPQFRENIPAVFIFEF